MLLPTSHNGVPLSFVFSSGLILLATFEVCCYTNALYITSLEGNNHVLPIQTLLQFANNSPSFSGGKGHYIFNNIDINWPQT